MRKFFEYDVDHDITIEGYVIQDKKETYFLTTKVEID